MATVLLAMGASLPAAAQVLSCDVTRVTDEATRSSLDAFSGDGNRVAFRSSADLTGENPGLDPELFIWDAGSGFIQVAPEVPADTLAYTGGLDFDGSHLAFVSEGDLTGGNPSGFPQLFLWEEGVGVTQLTNSVAVFSMQSVVIDGDGDRVVFASQADLTATNPDNSWEIFLWEEGAGITQITNTTLDSREPDISADGTRIAFRSQANLDANNADGNSEIFLWEEGAGFTQITDTTLVTNRDPSISADGGRIVLISPADLDGTPTPFSNLYVWDPGTGFQLVPGSDQALVTSVDADGDRTAWSDGSVWLWDETEGVASAPLDSEEVVMLDDAGDTVAFWSDSPLVGPNPDGEDEIYVADCAFVASVLEVPTLGSLGAPLLAGLLLAAGLLALRRSPVSGRPRAALRGGAPGEAPRPEVDSPFLLRGSPHGGRPAVTEGSVIGPPRVESRERSFGAKEESMTTTRIDHRSAAFAALAVLALVALPFSFAHAAEPSGATIDKKQDAAWTGSFVASNPLPVACSSSVDATCDSFALSVDARAGSHVAVAITTDDPGSIDLDLMVYAPNGELVKTSTTATATESLVFELDPDAHGVGAYEVRVQPWTVLPGATYQGVAMVTRAHIEGGVGVFPLDECSDMAGPDTFSLDLGDNILLDVMVLLDGVERARADEVMRVAASSYAPLNVSLKWRFREVVYTTDDANELISLAKAEFKGVRPKGYDIVYVMTTKDIQIGGDTMVAGLADCISGVSYDNHAFAVGEDFGAEEDAGRALGPFTHTVDGSAIVVSHEIGHLMGGHHHYGNCVEGNSLANVEDLELTPCTLMFNAVNFGSLPFGTLNSAVVRGHASEFARP